MRRGERAIDEETETEEIEEDITESETSVATNKKLQFLGIPLYKLSYKRLPKRCLKFSFLAINTATFVSVLKSFIKFHPNDLLILLNEYKVF